MIQLQQMHGRKKSGTHCVFDTDKVFRFTDGVPFLLGFVNRKEGAAFAPRVRMTDDELEETIAEINRIRKKRQNLGPVAGPGHIPPDPQAADEWQDENVTEEDADNE